MFKTAAFGSLFVAAQLVAACAAIGALTWTTHRDPAGFSVEIPEDWTVSTEEGRITVAGPNAERATIYPLRVEGQLDANRAQHLMVGLSNQLWPGQRWKMPQGGWQFGENGVRAIGADESELRETTALWWANTNQGASGFFYAVAAPPARFKAAGPVFARILESFRVTEANAQGRGESGRRQEGRGSDPLAGLQFQRWTDPTERAFSAEVPVGWRVSGGIRRNSATSRADEIVAQSPDGQIVRTNDASLPTQFMEPNPTLEQLGTHEGMMYPGTNNPVMRFRPAVKFATEYVQMKVSQTCGNLQFTSQRDRPDFIQALAAQGLLSNNQVTAGEVVFTCQSGGRPFVGYLFAETSRTVYQGLGNIWNAKVNGFIAPAGRATQADAVLQRIQASFRMNPQWWAAEVGTDERILKNFQDYRAFSANLQQQTQNERWASLDIRTEQTGDILRGQTRVVDPESGQAYKVEHTSNYYWVDTKHDVIAGTNIPYKPTWDFREMVQTYR
jgi:hypothetical protein